MTVGVVVHPTEDGYFVLTMPTRPKAGEIRVRGLDVRAGDDLKRVVADLRAKANALEDAGKLLAAMATRGTG